MTKTVSDKKTRQSAIPFIASSFYQAGYTTDSDAIATTDTSAVDSSGLIVPIRCATPRYANLVEAYLNLILEVDSSLSLKIAIGKFDADEITPILSYSQEYIDQIHKKLTGQEDALISSGGSLFVDGLNILPSIPKRGEEGFVEDGFIIILQFDRARTSSDHVRLFEVPCSALFGLYE